MKIWITYNTAGTLWSSGLQCVFVWFCKPTFMYRSYTLKQLEDAPFGPLSDKNGLREYGWEVEARNQKMWLNTSLSFGAMFGYDDRPNENENAISSYVWEKINAHFKNKPLGKAWDQLEKDGLSKPQDFLLEMEIDFTFKDASLL